MTPRVESPRLSKHAHVEVGLDVATLKEGKAKEPSREHEETVHE